MALVHAKLDHIPPDEFVACMVIRPRPIGGDGRRRRTVRNQVLELNMQNLLRLARASALEKWFAVDLGRPQSFRTADHFLESSRISVLVCSWAGARSRSGSSSGQLSDLYLAIPSTLCPSRVPQDAVWSPIGFSKSALDLVGVFPITRPRTWPGVCEQLGPFLLGMTQSCLVYPPGSSITGGRVDERGRSE